MYDGIILILIVLLALFMTYLYLRNIVQLVNTLKQGVFDVISVLRIFGIFTVIVGVVMGMVP